MKSTRTTDPQGRNWRVAVRMSPWSVRWRGLGRNKSSTGEEEGVNRKSRWFDGFDLLSGLDDGLGGFVMVIFAIVAIVVAILFVLPLFIFLIEVLIVAVLVAGATAIRVLFRQPWIVDAVADDGTHLSYKVVGYLKSRGAVDEIAGQLRVGTKEPNVREAALVR